MKGEYTAVVKKDGRWWIGWITEVPGANAQERTREKLLVSLKGALADMLEWNRSQAIQSAKEELETYEEVAIVL
jgi:predicted RNase H-like HicB family nuclease